MTTLASLATRSSYWWPIKRSEDNEASISVEAESESSGGREQPSVAGDESALPVGRPFAVQSSAVENVSFGSLLRPACFEEEEEAPFAEAPLVPRAAAGGRSRGRVRAPWPHPLL